VPVASSSAPNPTALQEAMAGFVDDPLGFVCFAFPWGTGELADQRGPDTWQTAVLEYVGGQCLTAPEALQVAVASGHGVGKTALVAWLLLWFLSTRPHPQAVVTANTKTQLDTKTWRELAKWHQRSVHRAWFAWTATRFYHQDHPATWFASAIPWSATNAEAFAGTHETDVLLLFDEASAIDDLIWETAEGAMTTPGALWLAFGNPTRNTGRFKECFPGGRFAHRWHALQVDSRSGKLANQAQIAIGWRIMARIATSCASASRASSHAPVVRNSSRRRSSIRPRPAPRSPSAWRGRRALSAPMWPALATMKA